MSWIGPAEDWAPMEPVFRCDPVPRAGVMAFRDWVLGRWGGLDLGIVRACEPGQKPTSAHHEGRAWDWAPRPLDSADEAIADLLANDGEIVRRAGIRNLIWRGQIWIAGQGWSPYLKSSHADHVHFAFSWMGAQGRTSFYQSLPGGGGVRAAPFPARRGSGNRGGLVGT